MNSNIFNKTKCFFCLPIIKAFFIILISYTFILLVILPTEVDKEIQKMKLQNSIESFVNKTCSDVFVTWAAFDEKAILDSDLQETPSVGRYVFEDVIGCPVRKENCAQSVKNLNPFFKVAHGVDLESYRYFNSFKNNEVRHIEDIESLKSKKAAYLAITRSISGVKDIYLITVKNHILINGVKTNVLYVFSIAHTKKTKYFCPESIAREKLKELYIGAENNI